MIKAIIMMLLFTHSSFADKLIFSQISIVPDFSINFILESNSDEPYANLDCQSFIKKLDFYSKDRALISENYISIQECEFLYHLTSSCLNQGVNKCFDTENYLLNTCSCE